MSQQQNIKGELSLSEIFSKIFDLYRQEFVKFFVLFVVVGAIIGAVTVVARSVFILPTLPTNPTSQDFLNWGTSGALIPLIVSVGIVSIVFSPIAQGAAIKLAAEQIERGQAELGASVRFATSKLISIWVLSIIVSVIVFLGFIALILPGILLAIMYTLALPALLLENKGVFESMRKSRELVKHRWVKTFATFLVLGIIAAVASAVVNAISGPFGPASPLITGILSALYEPLFPILLAVYYYSNVARIATVAAEQTAPASTVQTRTKFCVNCGSQLDASNTFCAKCGAKQPA